MSNDTLHKEWISGHNNTKICGTGKYECMKLAESILYTEEVYEKFLDRPKKLMRETTVDCNCMPLCTDLSYNTETSQTSWTWKEDAFSRSKQNLDKQK